MGVLALIAPGARVASLARLGWLIILAPLTLAVCVFLAWPILQKAKVVQAWQVALVGPVAVWACWQFLGAAEFSMQFSPVVAAAAGYAVAALVTAPTLKIWGRVVVVAAVAALFPLGTLVTDIHIADRKADELRRYEHPLFAPDVPDHRVAAASAGSGEFVYRLQPRLADEDPRNEIQAHQRLVPADFNPPAHCALDGRMEPEPCTLLAPEVWRISRGEYLVYLARKGDQVVEFRRGDLVPEKDLLAAATSLREVPLEHFTDRSP
ncbi:hypothetical protein LWC34_10980 [Kibdelosporangium philippinense]|uniref:Uncharacterized protein n=1 Tax=Kibdelosporangium philippinense TaxID=211113 RepID=A0ABS8Z639_9PSEU|nr:hypothetical protein [Kibdelosporangium philippinense]MCE7003346.1 hypothetical protein [Kibdelosporangium philippinense]